jgi:hypothetical protein
MKLLLPATLLLQVMSAAQIPDSIWTYEYSLDAYQEFCEILENTDGSFVAVGSDLNSASAVTLLAKLSAEGSLLWMREFCPAGAFSIGGGLCRTETGGYAIVSSAESDCWRATLTVTDPEGYLLHCYTYGYEDEDVFGIDVEQVPGNGYAFLANFTSHPGGIPQCNFMLIRISASGITLWTKYYGDEILSAYDLEVLPDGGFAIVGSRDTNAFLMRTDANGDSLWSRNLTAGGSQGYALDTTADGGFVVTGNYGAWFVEGVFLVRTDSNGDVIWERPFLSDEAVGYCVRQTWDSGYVVAAVFNNDETAYIIRTDAEGNELWQGSYGSAASGRRLTNTIETADGGYAAAGLIYEASEVDGWIIRLEPGLGLPGVQEHEPFALGVPSPNPFSSQVSISYFVEYPAEVAVNVYNASGRKVAGPFDSIQQAGEHTFSWPGLDSEGGACPAGIYFITVDCNGTVEAKPVVLLR